MAVRPQPNQSAHDATVKAAQRVYRNHGKLVWTNLGSEKSKAWLGYYIDVIAIDSPGAMKAYLVEVETADSVTQAEASAQWANYDTIFTTGWCLAVPLESKEEARALITAQGLHHCTLVTWQRNPDGTHTFWGLPGIG